MQRTLLPHCVVHLDADAFFASVEQAADVRLRGKPIAVGGQKRGIIASASYEARKFGVYTPMPTVMARRLCPKLIILPGDFEKYELFSRLMFSYAYDFTPDVEIGSIDEGYLDLTGARKPAVTIAETLQRAIRQSLKLSVSEGIGTNKLISQIASKLHKPAAFQFVPPGQESQFLAPLLNKWLPGIGPKTASQLNAAGLALIGQIAQTPPDLLGLLVGSSASQLRNFARGIDERPVVPARAPAKSYGEQETFAADTTDEPFLEATLRRMADNLMAKVRADGKSIRTFTVKVRYNDMDEDQAAESLPEPTDLETDLYSKLPLLLHKAWKRRVSLRLVSLRLSNVYEGRFSSGLGLDIPARQHDAQQRLADIVDELKEKFGPRVLLRGHDFLLRANSPSPPREERAGERRPFTSAQFHGKPHRCTPNQPKPLPLPRGEGRGEGEHDAQPPTPHPHHAYNLAVVQRQRLGHYALRQSYSPAPEIRFRTAQSNLIQPNPTKNPGGGTFRPSHLAPRTSPIPLNIHSYYSFLDSTLSINAIIDLAKRHDLPAIALTDKNNLHGAVEFFEAATKAGIKPIIGAKLEHHGHRLCLYVQNQTGYQNLCRILSELEREKSKARNQKSEARSQRSDNKRERSTPASDQLQIFNFQFSIFNSLSTAGLLALSPSPELAPFFPGRFYLEVNNPETHSRITHHASRIPRVASLPIHYASPSDRWKYDIVQSIRTLTLLRQAHPEKRLDDQYHFRPPAEMRRLFAKHPELLTNTHEIADRCEFQFSFGKPQFPGYTPTDGSTPADFLRRLVMDGLRRRYPKNHDARKSQIEQELAVITEVGYEEYFLVMWDILQECRRRGIEWITRGSAADSLVCYCLEISGVCPIRFDLYFRRFLNKERMALNKLPDIDVDFPHDRKDDVIDLIFEKFGSEKVAVVGGFSTFQSRSAFAEVAKVLGVSESQVRRFTDRLPGFSRAAELTEAVATSQECRDLPFEEDPYSTALQMAHFLDGFPRYAKMHPCGVVLSRGPMHHVTPTFISAKGYPTTHFDMDSVEAVGLVKMDILAQGGLAVMRDVKEMVKKRQETQENAISDPKTRFFDEKNAKNSLREPSISLRESFPDLRESSPEVRKPSPELRESSPDLREPSPDLRETTPELRESFPDLPESSPEPEKSLVGPLDLDALEPWTDPRVWELIASGQARAVHHIESPAMISLCKMCDVRDIDTLIAIVSVIRPGAANESKKMEFARRYQRLSPVHYPHPSLEPCLRSTFGLVVYEEHILQICEAFAGLPPGRADVLRRALGKDKTDLIAQIETEFANCARKLGRTETEITDVWNLVVGFKGYAFCKAHSTAYGVEAYQSAWLKLHYPAEFMAAVLTNGKGFYDPLVYVLECHRLGIPLSPPSVNEPGPQFTISRSSRRKEALTKNESNQNLLTSAATRSIRVPLLNIKGLTQRTKETILKERGRGPFTSLPDFFLRVQPLPEEMDSLIKAGAFDEFGESRTTQYWQFKQEAARSTHEPCGNLQFSIFNSQFSIPSSVTEPDRLQRLRWEEELLGYPVSGHPLELFPDIAWETYCPINRLGEHVGEQIVTCGLVIEQRLFHQVTGEPMKFITIADWTGVVETELFAKTYKSYGLSTIRYPVLEVTATVEPFENGRGFTLRVLRAGKPRTSSGKKNHAIEPLEIGADGIRSRRNEISRDDDVA